jgi:nucleoside-diphosphate-sugar epimerase
VRIAVTGAGGRPGGQVVQLLAAEAAHEVVALSRTAADYVDLTPAEHHVEMAHEGEDPWWMYAFSTMFASVRQQRWDSVSSEVLQLTGRQPASVLEALG